MENPPHRPELSIVIPAYGSAGILPELRQLHDAITTRSDVRAGWTSLMVIGLMLGGIQLLALGAIGEYLGRVFLTINSRPQFVVASTVNFEEGMRKSDHSRLEPEATRKEGHELRRDRTTP